MPASIVALVVGLALARAGFVYADTRVGASVGFRIRGLLQRNLQARIFRLPGARALPGSVGEALSTLRDDVQAMGEPAGRATSSGSWSSPWAASPSSCGSTRG